MTRTHPREGGRATRWTRNGRTLAGLAVAALAVAAALAGGGCGGEEIPAKLVIIGVDGMDWKLADPLIAEGRMPNLQRIIEDGVSRDFHSLEPQTKSPTIWTTIATGKSPRKHGISDFVEGTDEAPLYNSLGWRALPVWTILGDRGYSVGVVNWMVSWPAKPANGYWVSDRVGYSAADGFDEIEYVAYPPELAPELVPHAKAVSETSNEEIAYFMNGDDWATAEEWDIYGGVEGFREIYAADETIRQTVRYLLESRGTPDFLGVYFNGVDICSHRYWAQMDPSTVDLIMTQEFIDTFADLIPRYYEHIDTIIGEIVDLVDEGTTVMVLSDHGFRGPHRDRDGLHLGTWMHRPIGVFAAAGPAIAASTERTGDASVMDVTPTILALFGEPVARDMDGYVLTDVIDEAFLKRNPVDYIDTYESGAPDAEGEALESPVDEEIKERLRSLGYIE
jgi:predicted AlkP superfamily phosphohydrolase/phosphomutase